MSDYDVIVLGACSLGERCAGARADSALQAAVVEREMAGGECSYWACIPSGVASLAVHIMTNTALTGGRPTTSTAARSSFRCLAG